MDRRCISQNECTRRWQNSEATLERWHSQRKDPHFLKRGGQVSHRLADVESYEHDRLEVSALTFSPVSSRVLSTLKSPG